MKKKSMLLVIGIVVSILTGCGSAATEAKNAVSEVESSQKSEEIKKEQEEATTETSGAKPLEGVHLIMANDAEYAPFESVNENGETVGFDIDLNQALSEILGYTYEIEDMEFTGLISSISSGRCDYIISALTYSEERDEVVDFTDGYYTPVMAMVFKKDAGYSSIDDFRNLKLGTTMGSVYEKVIKKIEGAQLLTYDVVNEALPIIGTDELDAVLADSSNAISFCETDDSLTYMVVPISFTEDIMSSFNIILPEGSEYIELFNQALQELKENGRYEELIIKWFGEEYYEDLQKASE